MERNAIRVPLYLTHKRKNASLNAMVLLMAISCVFSGGIAEGASLKVSAHASLIDIEAHDALLIDILKGISEQTGIALKIGERLTEAVSCDIKAAKLEEAVKRLLAKRSYALSYRKTDDGRFLPERLTVLGDAVTSTSSEQPQNVMVFVPSIDPPASEETSAPPEGPPSAQPRFERKWFGQQFNSERMLSDQIAATPLNEGASSQGIIITDLSEESPLRKIGLDVGDVVAYVDGRPVQSSDELVQILSSLHNGQPRVRIERRRDGSSDPIYLEFQ